MPDRVRTRRQFARFTSPTGRGQSGPLRITFVREPSGVAAAYAISRRVGNAVTRNKIRRRLRALLDELSPPVESGIYLIRVGNEAGNLTYEQLQRHLSEAVRRATS